MSIRPHLIVTRGLPGSGKTTWAREWVALAPNLRARVNRDDMRQNLYGRPSPLPYALEEAVSAAQQEAVRGLLAAGKHVVVDDTHLRAKYLRAWREIAEEAGADFSINDDFLAVAADECVRRDRDRYAFGHGPMVGEQVIRDMAARLKNALRDERKQTDEDRFPQRRVYGPDEDQPTAWIVDVDGTLAHMNGRGPFDWARVGEDHADRRVCDLVETLYTAGHHIVIVSGRDGSCRAQTEAWLSEHLDIGPNFLQLLMREAGDGRSDEVVKAEIFWRDIAPYWNVLGVLDDRNKVVKMWRSLGLLCCQVAPGAF